MNIYGDETGIINSKYMMHYTTRHISKRKKQEDIHKFIEILKN
jgi:hypothetical protein